VIRRLAALLVALAATVTATAAAAGPAGHSILWSVRGEHNTVYLFGSIHVLRSGDVGLPPAAAKAYGDAERIVMEIDMDDPFVSDPAAITSMMQQSALLPPEKSLRTVLGSDYPAIAERSRAAGLDLEAMDRFAPWFVALLLLQIEITERGFDAQHGIEQQVTELAVADRKPITGLETPAEQFAVLGGLSMADQKRFLLMTLEESEQDDAQLDLMLDAWRRGDTAALARTLSEEFEDFPQLYRPLTEDRNRAWVGDLEALLDQRDDYLVVVGALHLVGRNSVVELLRQRGHSVTQH
jgi:hypothetical protein